MKGIWLIGGTRESREVVEWWVQHPVQGGQLVVTVATAAAIARYPRHDRVTVLAGRLGPVEATALVETWSIQAIVDMSHPFATEISRGAIALAQSRALPYLRYERPDPPEENSARPWRDLQGRPGLVTLPQWADLLTPTYLNGSERTLFTVGTRWLGDLHPWHRHSALFARVLPRPEALEAAQAAGFPSDRLVALPPPVPPALEAALWEHWRMTQVVTKASGDPGGEVVKRAIAARLGIRLILISRPPIPYPAQTARLPTVQTFITTHLSPNPNPEFSPLPPTLGMG